MAAHFGRRLRKGAATTAVAAAAVAALSASQAPGMTVDDADGRTSPDAASAPEESSGDLGATGDSPYYTDLPPLDSPAPEASTGSGPVTPVASEADIPATVLAAYQKAEAALRESRPACDLSWQLLAAIGKVESGQARGGRVDDEGTTTSPIIGPQLDGNGFALIKDTDNGAYDGNNVYDNAVGPMQFIPSTWAWAGRDGNDDGREDPHNVYDAALAAGHYLCRFGWDLSDRADFDKAILSYNNSTEYLNTVLSWLEFYRRGTHEVPDGTGPLPGNRSDGDTTSPTASTPDTGPSVPALPGAPSDPSPTQPVPSSPSPSQPSPSQPSPSQPSPSSPSPSSPSPSSPAPSPPAPSPSPPPSTSPTPTDTVERLRNAGTGGLTATAGEAFGERISTRAETDEGGAVAKVRIRFTVVGDTDTTFTGGESVATVLTDDSGVAVAPVLRAGEVTGDVTVRASVVGRLVPVLDYRATVTERVADAVVRTDDGVLLCTPDGEFAQRVEIRATRGGAPAGKVEVAAALVTSADDPGVNDRGPYFKDADDQTVRVLSGLRTDADGLLKLPRLYADDTTGTFLLRLTLAGGVTLTVELTVAADETVSPGPGPSTSPGPAADV